MSILVLDAGSSALKAVLFDEQGRITAQAEAGYAPEASGSRPDPEAWWEAACAAVAALGPAGPAAIALTGTMENLIPVAADGTPAGRAILYSDACGGPYLEAIDAQLEAVGAGRIAGNAPEPLMTAFKAAWLRENEPDVDAAARFLLPGAKDFLALRMTGQAATDPACAATTGLMDLQAREWSETLLTLLGIPRHRLPMIRPAATVLGPLRPDAAAALGLPAGTPVVNGCGDGGATTLGGGAEAADDVSLYLGTSGWVARVVPTAGAEAPRPYYRLPHPLHEGLIEISPILSGGAAASWARHALGLEIAAAEAGAAEADKAPKSIVFLPYLSGERSPFLDLSVRGSFLGLDAGDGAGDLYYAVLEGVALAIAANLDAMGGAAGRVSLAGGGALSATWPAILADALDRAILVPQDPVSATAAGAFRIARHALGLPAAAASGGRTVLPRPERRERMARQRARFAEATEFARRFGS